MLTYKRKSPVKRERKIICTDGHKQHFYINGKCWRCGKINKRKT